VFSATCTEPEVLIARLKLEIENLKREIHGHRSDRKVRFLSCADGWAKTNVSAGEPDRRSEWHGKAPLSVPG
jgi:hypothetical protein